MTTRKLLTGLVLLLLSCGPRTGSATAEAPLSAESIPGNYSMKMVVDGQTHYSTAVVKRIPDGRFQIARITVYGPVNYHFSMDQNSLVVSEELGSGKASYQSQLNKTTIRFEKEGALCELSR